MDKTLDRFISKSLSVIRKHIDSNIEKRGKADDIVFNLFIPKGEFSKISPEDILSHESILFFRYKGYILMYIGNYSFKVIKPLPDITIF